MMAPKSMTRTSIPLPFTRVNMVTESPVGSVPKRALVTAGPVAASAESRDPPAHPVIKSIAIVLAPMTPSARRTATTCPVVWGLQIISCIFRSCPAHGFDHSGDVTAAEPLLAGGLEELERRLGG